MSRRRISWRWPRTIAMSAESVGHSPDLVEILLQLHRFGTGLGTVDGVDQEGFHRQFLIDESWRPVEQVEDVEQSNVRRAFAGQGRHELEIHGNEERSLPLRLCEARLQE